MLHKLLVMFLLVAAVAALAQPTPQVLVATGKEVRTETVAPGAVICGGGQPTGQIPPCSPTTTNIMIRGMSNKYVAEEVTGSAAAMLGGWNITFVNGDLDANWCGHLWGAAQWTVPEMGGVWQGVFFAVADQARGFVINKAMFFGSGGKLEGLKMDYYAVSIGGKTTFVAVVTGK